MKKYITRNGCIYLTNDKYTFRIEGNEHMIYGQWSCIAYGSRDLFDQALESGNLSDYVSILDFEDKFYN